MTMSSSDKKVVRKVRRIVTMGLTQKKIDATDALTLLNLLLSNRLLYFGGNLLRQYVTKGLNKEIPAFEALIILDWILENKLQYVESLQKDESDLPPAA
jgi:hypothetical protein